MNETFIIIIIATIFIVGMFLTGDIEFFSNTDDLLRYDSWQSAGN